MKNCDVCKRDENEETGFCSNYCATVVAKEQDEFLAIRAANKVGAYCVYPCPGCGTALEGDWASEFMCAPCTDKAYIKDAQKLLRSTLGLAVVPLNLRQDIQDLLAKRPYT